MLKKIIIATLFAFALTSCDPASNTGADGYKFGTPQYEKQQVQIDIVTYNSQKDLVAAAKARGVDNPDIVAFSIIKPPFDACTVHMVKPTVSYDPEFVGHEFLHCVYGQWHTNNESRS
jgi:hypothetical protein